MKFSSALVILVLCFSTARVSRAAEAWSPCVRLQFDAQPDPGLTPDETRLLCGDPSIPEWSSLPQSQLEFHLRSALASRGYHAPKIERTRAGTTQIQIGALTRVTRLEWEGAPPLDRAPEFHNRPLTAAVLNEIRDWLTGQLRERGYICPRIEMAGNRENGHVRAQIDPGPVGDFSATRIAGALSLDPEALARYRPFNPTDRFRTSWLRITEMRTADSGLVFSNHFAIGCEQRDAPTLVQQVIEGPPRLLRLAVGANTEVGPIARVQWAHTRFWSAGSSAQLEARASFRDQLVSGSAQFFADAGPLHWTPSFSFGRVDESRMAYFLVHGRFGVRSWTDSSSAKFTGFAGLNADRIQRLEGEGLGETFATSFDLEGDLMSHSLELDRGNPHTGTLVRLKASATARGVLADQNSFRVDLSASQFINPGSFDPERIVFVLRGRLAGTITDEMHNAPQLLPLPYRNFLGGANSVRGFGLNEIPYSDAGGLTAAFLGFETRIAVPYVNRLYALAFWDLGMLGVRQLELDPTLYHSPGIGIYWLSPVGVVKATFAHGMMENASAAAARLPTHWQFYIALGETL